MEIGKQDKSSQIVNSEFTYSLGLAVILTIITVVFKDPLTPFYSFVFVIGTTIVFFLSITFGPRYGIEHAAALLALMFWVNLSKDEGMSAFSFQAPFLVIFFLLLALVPNLRPQILALEVRKVKDEIKSHERKVEELEAVLKKEHKEQVAEKSNLSRKESAKLSSRNTMLTTFARSLLQAGSVREILNLLFYSISKSFAAQQCAMLIDSHDSHEFIFSRVIHPEHGRIENTRCSKDIPYFQQVLDKKKLIAFPGPTSITEDLDAEIIFPVVLSDEVHAIFTIAEVKDGKISDDDRFYIETLAILTSHAAEQLQVVTAL